MIFNFKCTVNSKSVLRFPLDHLVYEVSSFNRPSSRYFPLLDLDLLGENVVSNFLSRLPNIGSPSVHALISHHAHSKVVYCSGVILSTHYLWGHVPRCSRSVLCVLWPPNSSNTEVSDSNVSIVINDQVFRLDISVNDLLIVAILKAGDQAGNEKTYKI